MTPEITKDNILKYDLPGPRYTSYPTAPEWTTQVNASVYQARLLDLAKTDKTLSLYVHIPFCQSLCYFCACNVVIRSREDRYADEYLAFIFQEIDTVGKILGTQKRIRQLNWGGGTPNYLSEPQMERLFKKIEENFDVDLSGEIALEIDPRTIEKSQLKKMKSLGFNRISLGIQDFDPEVQSQINRIQSYEIVKEVTDQCRDLEFHSINYDLVYGLPHQTKESFQGTLEKVIRLKPDRIALYSFAYVPWLKKHQTKFQPNDLPNTNEKLEIFLQARQEFLQNGYQAIAMDHFALHTDELSRAFRKGTLYRNFMGYTVKPADEFLGFGVSSIGFFENTYIQNYKTLPQYYHSLRRNELPVERGKVLSPDDRIRQWVIQRLMCRFEIDREEFQKKFSMDFDDYFAMEQDHVQRCITEGLLVSSNGSLKATDLGRIFIRNVCMGFDWYLRQKDGHRAFSRTV